MYWEWGHRAVVGMVVVASAAILGACVIRVDTDSRAYPCESNGECADENGCLVGANGSFCAPVCDSECAVCSEQELCLATCSDSAECPAGLTCVTTEADGYCSTGYQCSRDADCQPGAGLDFEPLAESFCTSAFFDEGNQCVFPCLEDQHCPPGYECTVTLAGTGDAQGLCTLPCTTTDGCPPGYTCLDAPGLVWDGRCLPGIPGLDCDDRTSCIVGDCQRVADTDGTICTRTCDDAADCDDLEVGKNPADFDCVAGTDGTSVCAWEVAVCEDIYCSIFGLDICAQVVAAGAPNDCVRACSAADFACPSASGDECRRLNPFLFGELGVCLTPCTSAAPCNRTHWGCLTGAFLWEINNHCIPGLPFVLCDSKANCIDGGECLPAGVLGADVCMFPCTEDSDCDPVDAPLLFADYSCTYDFMGSTYCSGT